MSAIAADAVLVLHLLFIVFAVLGGLLVVWRPRFAWLHLPAVAWGVWIELSHGICPLTPLENALRRASGATPYSETFIEHYLLPLIYPKGLTHEHQVLFAAILAAINLGLYAWAVARWRRRRSRIMAGP